MNGGGRLNTDSFPVEELSGGRFITDVFPSSLKPQPQEESNVITIDEILTHQEDEDTDTGFIIPRKQILTKEDLERFQKSQAYEDYMNFILDLNMAVRNVTSRAECHTSEVVVKLMELLNTLKSWIEEFPPDTIIKTRYGNPSFQKWYDKLNDNAAQLLEDIIKPPEAIPELATYLIHSFGDRKRIDYGTGHETTFMAFLFCMNKLGLFTSEDYTAIVIKVFLSYMSVMRKLQYTYWLEPAGSHGVWGLDDYHFMPFLFGSSQLHDHKYLRPKSIRNEEIVEEFSKDYMYLDCIKFICSIKTASLRWHSPMLDDISGVKKWMKVNSGMIKMYKAEVLGKLPIMQHFLFGSLIKFHGSHGALPEEHDHSHVYAMGQEAPCCCGIHIPSPFGAALDDQKNNHNHLPKPIPFD